MVSRPVYLTPASFWSSGNFYGLRKGEETVRKAGGHVNTENLLISFVVDP